MGKKFVVTTVTVLVFSVAFVPLSRAGADMIIDNSAQAPPPYTYVPPPPVYYAPAPVQVVVYPTYRYFVRPARLYTYHRSHWRHADFSR